MLNIDKLANISVKEPRYMRLKDKSSREEDDTRINMLFFVWSGPTLIDADES